MYKEGISPTCFLRLSLAKQCWLLFSEILGVKVGDNIAEIGKFWLSSKKHVVLNMITSAVLWYIWKFKNDICFQNSGRRSIETLLHRIPGFYRIG